MFASLQKFYDMLPPFIHDVWAQAILEPRLPALHNTDGDPLLLTRVVYEVLDASAATAALSKNRELDAESDGTFRWCGDSQQMKSALLGHVRIANGRLTLEVNSSQRAERGRALVEACAGAYIRYQATSHEDLNSLMERHGSSPPSKGSATPVPPALAESLVLDYQARHYRGWLDEAIPALDGATPRQAARQKALREKLVSGGRSCTGGKQPVSGDRSTSPESRTSVLAATTSRPAGATIRLHQLP